MRGRTASETTTGNESQVSTTTGKRSGPNDNLRQPEATKRNPAASRLLPDLRLLDGGIDPVAFAESVGLHPDPWQAAVLRSMAPRLLLCCSRQSGKSTVCAVRALHRALYWPGSLVLLVSPSQRQSGELFRKVTALLPRLEPRPAMPEENKLSLELANGSRVVSLPSNAATVRGFSGAALIIEDEAAFVRDDFYSAMRPMLATTRGALVLMSTPFGKRGHFHDAWEHGGDAWERTSIPATACPRISAAFLEGERAALGEWRYRQEYACEFVESSDQFFAYAEVMAALSAEVHPLFGPGADPDPGVSATVIPLFGGAA